MSLDAFFSSFTQNKAVYTFHEKEKCKLVEKSGTFLPSTHGRIDCDERYEDPHTRSSRHFCGDFDFVFESKLVSPSVSCELIDKELILYERGDHFDEHVDRDRSTSEYCMLGTLLFISFHDDCVGGDLQEFQDVLQKWSTLPLRKECWNEVFIPLGVRHRVDTVRCGARKAVKFTVVVKKTVAET